MIFESLFFFMMNELAWQHETSWFTTKSALPPTTLCLVFQANLSPDVLIHTVPLHIIFNAPTSYNCSSDVSEIHTRKVRGSVFFFFLLVYSMMLLEELCCPLVYLLTNGHITVFDNNKCDLHYIQKDRTQTSLDYW